MRHIQSMIFNVIFNPVGDAELDHRLQEIADSINATGNADSWDKILTGARMRDKTLGSYLESVAADTSPSEDSQAAKYFLGLIGNPDSFLYNSRIDWLAAHLGTEVSQSLREK